MIWNTSYYYQPQYEYVSTNQHGNRFKRASQKMLNTVIMSCEIDGSLDIQQLILLSHSLDVPVHYNFKAGKAYIEVMSAEQVRRT